MKKALIISTVILLILTLLPLIDLHYGWIRIWGFPRLQIAVLMIITLIGWAFKRPRVRVHKVLVVLLVAATIHQVVKFIPYTFAWKPEIADTRIEKKDASLSILFYNVYMKNKRTDDFLKLAAEVNADVILLAETDEFWKEKMTALHPQYPNRVLVPLGNTYGMCLYSKLPLSSAEVKYLIEPDIPSIHTMVTLPNGQQVKLYCIHPEPPDLKKSTADRDAELIVVAKEIAKNKQPVIVAGDLNDVAWSSTTTLFGRISNCNDPRVGRGLYSTFNAKYPLLRWPLDHFFTSDQFTLNQIQKYDYIGSDHFPISIRVTYDPSQASANKDEQPDEADLEEASDKLGSEKNEEKKQ